MLLPFPAYRTVGPQEQPISVGEESLEELGIYPVGSPGAQVGSERAWLKLPTVG